MQQQVIDSSNIVVSIERHKKSERKSSLKSDSQIPKKLVLFASMKAL